ncbi:hypothetical protein [Kitasatospora sp. NPDC093806]|uniref:hypothetical protein n=1 Tax=Kitasatospora sp. NPDC093806 TaxID=3155075 RepID=UPI00341D8455
MVSFKELHEADFAGVTETAEAWSKMATALDGLDNRVGRDLTGTPQRAGWEGPAAVQAGATLKTVDTDFTQAAGVARALAAIIRDAAEDFTAARKDLDTAIHDAETQTMTVTPDGEVRWPPMPGSRNDPDAGAAVKKYDDEMKGKAQAISDRLAQAVRKAAAADQRAATALRTDIGTSTTAFNPKPYGGGDAADGRRAADLMAKGGSLSDAELKRLQDLMATGAGSKDFATSLLNSLDAGGKGGPEALLDYTKVYGDLAHGNRNAQQYQDVYGSLAQVLATATKDGGMGGRWEDDLLKSARRPGGSAAGYNDNYRALTELMGTGGDFDKPFLKKVGADLVDYERGSKLKGEELWSPDFTAVTGRQGDPVRGLMKALSRNPEAAKEFFDPAAGKNLDYLLKDRAWPNQGYEQKQPDALARDTSRGALGDALQAATTGRDPHGAQPAAHPHDPATARIMDQTLKAFGGGKAGGENDLPAGLRHPFAEMIADYAPDVHEILGKELHGPSKPDGLTVSRDQLLRVARGTLEDPASFAIIHQAETREVARQLDAFGPGAFTPDATGRPNATYTSVVHNAAGALGALDAIYADSVMDHADADKAENAWKAKMAYHVIGTPVNMITQPLGDIGQRLVDVGTSKWLEGANGGIDTAVQGDLSTRFSVGREQLMAMIDERALQTGYTGDLDADCGIPKQLRDETKVYYNTSIDQAYRSTLGRG